MRNAALLSTLLLAIVAVASGTGCAFGELRPDDPFKRQFSLEDAQKEYTDFVRWSKFQEAAAYVAPEDRKAFFARMPDFDVLRFTDWESRPWEFEDQEEKNKAIIEVTYRGYSMRTPFEVKVTETQTWTRTGSGNSWTVHSEFQNLDRFAAF